MEADSTPDYLKTEGYSLKWEDHFNELNPKNWTIGLKDQATGDLVPGAHGQYLLNDQICA